MQHTERVSQTGMPLKTKSQPDGLFTPQEVYDQLSDMFTAVYNNSQPEGSWELLQKVKKNVELWQVITQHKLKEWHLPSLFVSHSKINWKNSLANTQRNS